jgi:hypothetical protein
MLIDKAVIIFLESNKIIICDIILTKLDYSETENMLAVIEVKSLNNESYFGGV